MDSTSNEELHQEAIDAAINCKWDNAIDLNQEIIEKEPSSIPALNRLAKAYCEVGKFLEAKKTYQNALSIDPYNTIALKNLKKVSVVKSGNRQLDLAHFQHKNGVSRKLQADLFLQEPGITKLVNLIKIAEPAKLLTLSAGSVVELVPKLKSVVITDEDSTYLGVLPDDIAYLLIKLIKGGNKYEVIVRSVKQNAITVLIRETYRAKRFRNQPSFLDEVGAEILSFDNLSVASQEQVPDRSVEVFEENT